MCFREAGGGDAVVGTGPTFTIAAVQAEDVGTYTCSALSVAGVDRANASLVLFGETGVGGGEEGGRG